MVSDRISALVGKKNYFSINGRESMMRDNVRVGDSIRDMSRSRPRSRCRGRIKISARIIHTGCDG